MTKAEEYINSIPKFAGKTELKNTEILLNELGIDTDDMKIIHVAGTNGKGSVCSYISNTLVKAGYKTGLFISPHLVKINERIQIDDVPVSDDIFESAYERVLEAAHRMEQSGGKHPAYFEFLFGMAMLVFKEQKVQYIVLETGMGGRLDSTNVVKKPLMTVITSVSMDAKRGSKSGLRRIDIIIEFPSGTTHLRPSLPLPADWNSATASVPCTASSFERRLHHSFVESISFAKWTVLPAHSVCISFEIVSVL